MEAFDDTDYVPTRIILIYYDHKKNWDVSVSDYVNLQLPKDKFENELAKEMKALVEDVKENIFPCSELYFEPKKFVKYEFGSF